MFIIVYYIVFLGGGGVIWETLHVFELCYVCIFMSYHKDVCNKLSFLCFVCRLV